MRITITTCVCDACGKSVQTDDLIPEGWAILSQGMSSGRDFDLCEDDWTSMLQKRDNVRAPFQNIPLPSMEDHSAESPR